MQEEEKNIIEGRYEKPEGFDDETESVRQDILNEEEMKLEGKVRAGGLFMKIFLTALICMIVPMLVSSLVTTKYARKVFSDDMNENLTQLAAEKNFELSSIIDNQVELVKAVTSSPYVKTVVAEKLATGDLSVDEGLCDYLATIAEASNGMYENFFITAGSMGIADFLGGETVHDVTGETSYESSLAGGLYIGTEVSPVSGNPVMNVVSTITDDDGNVLGILNNAMDLGVVTQTMMNSFGEDSDMSVIILDATGLVVASANADEILTLDFSAENESTQSVISAVASADTGSVTFTLNGVENSGSYATANNFICRNHHI